MSDPNTPGDMSITLKHDGKDATWLVFRGSPTAVREQIVETFAFGDTAAGLTLHELSLEATRLVKGTGNAGSILGARPVASTEQSSGEQSAPAEEKQPPTIAEQIEATTSVDELRELWLNEADAIKAGNLVDAWKEKGAALKAAA